MGNYYVSEDGNNPQGPFSKDDLLQMVKRKEISVNMYCWSKGMDKWHRIYKVFPEVAQRKFGKPILPPQPMVHTKLTAGTYAVTPQPQHPKATYHVSQKGQILGPYPKDKIKHMHQEGRILHDAKVCKNGTSHWVSLSAFLGQSAVHVPPPPPPPAAVPPPPPPPAAVPPPPPAPAPMAASPPPLPAHLIRYHLNTNGTVYGPATEAELYAMYCNGYVNPTSCVCPLGGMQWFPIAQAFVWAANCAPQMPPPITPQAAPAPAPPPPPPGMPQVTPYDAPPQAPPMPEPPQQPVPPPVPAAEEPPPEPQPEPAAQAEAENKQYYLYHNEEVAGPLSEAELHSMYYKGEINDQELTCQDGSEDWQSLADRFSWVAAASQENA